MYTIHPMEEERYYLRLLLLHVKGATSFEDLKTVNSIVHPTFKEAAIAMGLLLNDDVWKKTLQDGVLLQMSKQLHEMFAYICVIGAPRYPIHLWNQFKEHFIEDYCYHIHNNNGDCQGCEGYAMMDVQKIMIHMENYKRILDYQIQSKHQTEIM